MSMPVVCSIGTTDPWNAAGVGLDIRILAECGVRAVTVVAAISAQDAAGVRAIEPTPPELIREQWASLDRAQIAAVRIGALCGAAAVRTVASMLSSSAVPVVYDPALHASRGGAFADAATVAMIRSELLPTSTVCTPNLAEAAELSESHVTTVAEMEAAAGSLRQLGARAVLVTGGHLAGDPTDVLVDDEGASRFSAPRIDISMRGTGCVLSCALAAELAKGVQLKDALERARAFVRMKIAGAVRTGDFYIAS